MSFPSFHAGGKVEQLGALRHYQVECRLVGKDVAINIPDMFDDLAVTLVEEQGVDEDVSG